MAHALDRSLAEIAADLRNREIGAAELAEEAIRRHESNGDSDGRLLDGEAAQLFEQCDVLALPSATLTPPPVADLEEIGRYAATNAALLRATCAVSVLDLCVISIPVGRDAAGMPVGLQLVAPSGRDELLLAAALAAEQVLGGPADRLGVPC